MTCKNIAGQVYKTTAMATIAAAKDYLFETNELYTSSTNSGTEVTEKIHGQSLNFLPWFTKLLINCGGSDWPGTATFDNSNDAPQWLYWHYKDQFKHVENPVSFHDWVHRYFVMQWDFWGHKGLFESSPTLVDTAGIETTLSTMRWWYELAFNPNQNANLKAYFFHYVPTTIIFNGKSSSV